MAGPIEIFMQADHVRLGELLRRSERPDGTIDEETYAVFREGLLRHIAMEEKVLLPFARAMRAGHPLPIARILRADHGRIAKLLVPTPSSATCAQLRALLAEHDRLEEGPGGLYETCDKLAAGQADELVTRLRMQPTVPVAKYYDGPLLARASRSAADEL